MVDFLKNRYKIQPLACAIGGGIECLLCAQSLIYIWAKSLQLCMQYNVLFHFIPGLEKVGEFYKISPLRLPWHLEPLLLQNIHFQIEYFFGKITFILWIPLPSPHSNPICPSTGVVTAVIDCRSLQLISIVTIMEFIGIHWDHVQKYDYNLLNSILYWRHSTFYVDIISL